MLSFEDLGGGYGKDAFRVYYLGAPVEGAAASSFRVLQGGYARDAFGAYFQGRPVAT